MDPCRHLHPANHKPPSILINCIFQLAITKLGKLSIWPHAGATSERPWIGGPWDRPASQLGARPLER